MQHKNDKRKDLIYIGKKLVGKMYVLAYDDGTFDYNVKGDFDIIPATFTAIDDVLVDLVKDGILYKEDVPLLFDKYKKTAVDVIDGKFELD